MHIELNMLLYFHRVFLDCFYIIILLSLTNKTQFILKNRLLLLKKT